MTACTSSSSIFFHHPCLPPATSRPRHVATATCRSAALPALPCSPDGLPFVVRLPVCFFEQKHISSPPSHLSRRSAAGQRTHHEMLSLHGAWCDYVTANHKEQHYYTEKEEPESQSGRLFISEVCHAMFGVRNNNKQTKTTKPQYCEAALHQRCATNSHHILNSLILT